MTMTLRIAAKHIDRIRNSSFDAEVDRAALLAELNVIGFWLAEQKNGKTVFALLDECHALADRLQGGSGKFGVRFEIAQGV